MTIINTSDDLLTLLRENPDFREAARQAIMTEELLALPAVFSAFASEMRGEVQRLGGGVERLEGRVGGLEEGQQRLEEGQQRLEGRVGGLEEGQQRLEGRVGGLEEGQQRLEGRMGGLEGRMGGLEEGQQRLEGRMGDLEGRVGGLEGRVERLEFGVDSLRGSALEAKLSTKLIPLVGREFDVRRIYPIWAPGIIAMQGNTQEFHDRMERAVEDGVIDDDDEIRLRVTDFVMRSQRKADRSTVWFTIEASGIINDDDITRSKQSANAIEKIYGQDAIALVYGYGIHEDQMKLAEELDVLVYLDPDRM